MSADPSGAAAPRVKKPIYKRVWFWLVIALVIVVAYAATRGGQIPQPTSSSTAASTTGQTSASPTQSSEPDPTEAAEAPSISNGDHLVGTSLAAGTYRCSVDETSIIPYAAVSQTGSDGTVMDIRNASAGSVIFIVKDVAGSVVNFQGCETVGLATDMVRANPSPVTNGDWLVGTEIPAGQYQCAVDTTADIPYGSVTQLGADGTVMDLGNGAEGNIIFTIQEAAGSIASFQGCASITMA